MTRSTVGSARRPNNAEIDCLHDPKCLSTPVRYLVPEGFLYTKEHEWAKITGDVAKIGITDYAAKTLNDVVYLTLPTAGQELKQLSTFGTVESIKAVSELYSPLSGKVVSTNSELATHPELVNQSPYEAGWIVELRCSNLEGEKRALLAPKQYEELLQSLAAGH
jgi:glycine cleavage system H protein